jgi:hypothetical protein
MLLRTHLTLFTTLSLVGLCANATAQQTQIDPTSTFLRTDPGDTQASAPLLLDLAQLGYQPGQTITIRTVGDFIWHPGQQLSGDAAVAVFSSSTTVLPAANAHRVPGAIQSTAPAYVTGPTYQTSLATDIPQDFFVGPAGVSVQIPNNGMGSAPYLLIGADDEFWGDNLDADHDFAIVIERPLGQELLTNGGFETGDTSGWQAGPGTGVTDYGQALTPAVSVSTLIQGGNKLATGGGVMVQAFDVSGNSAEIDNGTMYVQLGGYFGGYLQHGNWTALQAIFENGNGGSTGGTVDVGRIDWVNRNSQTTLMRREGVFRLPVGTRLLRIQLWLNYAGGGNVVLADNLSAKLVGNWAPTAQSVGAELLDNRGFETGIINPASPHSWIVTSGSAGVLAYGGTNAPSAAVQADVQGGSNFVYGGGALEQVFDVSGNSTAIDNGTMYVQLGGYFGGYLQHGNWTALQAIFENGNGGSTGGTVDVGRIDWVNRNSQTTLMRREGVFRLPVGTRLLRIQLWLNYAGGGNLVFADNLSAKLVSNWTPTAQSVGPELLDNRGFESGIINPASPHSWIVTSGSAGVLAYGGANTPATTVQAAVNGGSNFVYGGGALEQAFDVSGNSAEIDNGTMYVHLGGYFGGYLQHGNWTALQAIFENGNGGSTGSTVDVGRIDWVNRNSQTTLMRREGVFRLPVGTRLLRIQLWLNYAGGGNLVFADNLSAKLVSNWAPTPVPLGSELLDNGNFETGNVINPAIERSWTGAGGNPMAILNYGAPNQPLPGVANTIGGGSFLGRSSGGVCEVVQWLDLRGNATDIDAQNLALHLEGHFGGVTNNGGTAHFRVETYSAFGGIIGTYTVGGVTPAERNNVTTLLFKEGDILLDYGTRRVAIILHYTDGNGLADNLKAQLLDVTTPLVYPGTGDGLVLLTGVNAVPSGGPREDIKQAYAGNILTLHTASPSNVFDGAPLFFAGNAFSTSGSVPFFGLPGLHVNPVFGGFFWLMNPTVPIGPFGSPIVVPGGTTMNFVVPNGLGGYSMLFQAMTLSSVAANSLYATSDAHEIQFQ